MTWHAKRPTRIYNQNLLHSDGQTSYERLWSPRVSPPIKAAVGDYDDPETTTPPENLGPYIGGARLPHPDRLRTCRAEEEQTEAPAATRLRVAALRHGSLLSTEIVTKKGLRVRMTTSDDEREKYHQAALQHESRREEPRFDPRKEECDADRTMAKELPAMNDFGVFDEVHTRGSDGRYLADTPPAMWVKCAKGAEVCCRLPISLEMLLLSGLSKNPMFHAELKETVCAIPPGEFYPDGGDVWKLQSDGRHMRDGRCWRCRDRRRGAAAANDSAASGSALPPSARTPAAGRR